MTNAVINGLVQMSNEAYHAADGISKSHTDAAAAGPQHYWAKYIDPNRQPFAPTDDMRIGTLIHAAVLEPDEVGNRYIVLPEEAPNRPTSRQINAKKPSPETLAAIDWWREFEEKAKGKEIVPAEWLETAWNCRKAIFAEPYASRLLSNGGTAEQSIFATDPETGILMKCRPDFLTPQGIMVDIKSARDASEDGFGRAIGDRRYYVQHPFYGDTFKHAFGETMKHFFFVAVEKTYPYNVGVYYLDEEQIEKGRERYKKDIRVIQEVRSGNGEYPGGYTAKTGPRRANIPPFCFK